MPAELELVFALPDHFEGKAAFLAEIRQRITDVERACAAERQRTGRQVIRRRRILRQAWHDRPASREPRRGLRPRIAARDPALRLATMRRNKAWVIAYNDARARLPVEVPFGTYALRRFANIAVKPPPEPW